MISLGLDLSTSSTGWAVVSDRLTLKDKGVIQFGASVTHKDRLVLLSSTLSSILERHKLDYTIIEDTYVSKNIATTKLLNKYSGVAIYTVYKQKVDTCKLVLITPVSVRSAWFPKNKNKQTKEYIYSYMCNKFKLSKDTPNDITDAIAIAAYPHLKEVPPKWIL